MTSSSWRNLKTARSRPVALLHRGRTGRTGARRGGHPAQRPTDPVPDEIWDEAARHYKWAGLAALILMIVTTNFFKQAQRQHQQPAGAWG